MAKRTWQLGAWSARHAYVGQAEFVAELQCAKTSAVSPHATQGPLWLKLTPASAALCLARRKPALSIEGVRDAARLAAGKRVGRGADGQDGGLRCPLRIAGRPTQDVHGLGRIVRQKRAEPAMKTRSPVGARWRPFRSVCHGHGCTERLRAARHAARRLGGARRLSDATYP